MLSSIWLSMCYRKVHQAKKVVQNWRADLLNGLSLPVHPILSASYFSGDICLRYIWTISAVPLLMQNSLCGQVSLHLSVLILRNKGRRRNQSLKSITRFNLSTVQEATWLKSLSPWLLPAAFMVYLPCSQKQQGFHHKHPRAALHLVWWTRGKAKRL